MRVTFRNSSTAAGAVLLLVLAAGCSQPRINQQGGAAPAVSRAPSDIQSVYAGRWTGTIDPQGGNRTEVVLDIAVGADGVPTGQLLRPGANRVPVPLRFRETTTASFSFEAGPFESPAASGQTVILRAAGTVRDGRMSGTAFLSPTAGGSELSGPFTATRQR